jgi:hypothetical protein
VAAIVIVVVVAGDENDSIRGGWGRAEHDRTTGKPAGGS